MTQTPQTADRPTKERRGQFLNPGRGLMGFDRRKKEEKEQEYENGGGGDDHDDDNDNTINNNNNNNNKRSIPWSCVPDTVELLL